MAFVSAPNSGTAQLTNALTRIFVGDPKTDAEIRRQQLQGETEMARQKYLQEQATSEATRRLTMEAQANAANAAAQQHKAAAGKYGAETSSVNRENQAHEDLGKYFTQFQPQQLPEGVQGPPGPPVKQFNLNDPTQAAAITGIMLRGGIKPDNASILSLMPSNTDDTLGRIYTAGGHNPNTVVPAGSRVVGASGAVRTPVDPSYEKHGGRDGGNKVPRLEPTVMNQMIRDAIRVRGANIPMLADGKTPGSVSEYLAAQPELYSDMARLISEGWNANGGNAAAVQDLLSQYLADANFKDFGMPTGGNDWIPFNEGSPQLIKRPDVNEILKRVTGGQGFDPSIMTGGAAAAAAPLPNLQNVGNAKGPVRVSTPDEAMALPSGTQFVTPDGRIKVRP